MKTKRQGITMDNIVRVHRPELTAAERERRMKQIKEAAARLIAATELQKKKPTYEATA